MSGGVKQGMGRKTSHFLVLNVYLETVGDTPKLLLMTSRKWHNAQCAFYWHHDRWPWTAISSNFRIISPDFAALGGNNSKPNEVRYWMYSSELCSSLHWFAEDFFAIACRGHHTVYTLCRALTLARLSCVINAKKHSLWHQLTAQLHIENSENKKMVIKLLQQSTFRRYAAIVLSPFFIFAVFDV